MYHSFLIHSSADGHLGYFHPCSALKGETVPDSLPATPIRGSLVSLLDSLRCSVLRYSWDVTTVHPVWGCKALHVNLRALWSVLESSDLRAGQRQRDALPLPPFLSL